MKFSSSLLLIIVGSLFLSFSAQANSGHRLGGDIYAPENTIYSFRLALKNLVHKSSFKYAELDIQESKDGVAVVFHDLNRINRIVPASAVNLRVLQRVLQAKKFKNITIADLNLAEIRGLVLEHDARIPTLKEALDTAVEWKLKKPFYIEIKELRTDACRAKTIKLVGQYSDKIDVNFLAFKKNYLASFPDTLRWSHMIQRSGLKAFTCARPKTGIHNQVKKFVKKANLWGFSTVADTYLHFRDEQTRDGKIPVRFNWVKGNKYGLRIGIHHGYDNTGDKGLSFELRTKKGKLVHSGFSSAKHWEWFQTEELNTNDLVITVKDKDTKFSGRSPGNRARLKVNLIQL